MSRRPGRRCTAAGERLLSHSPPALSSRDGARRTARRNTAGKTLPPKRCRTRQRPPRDWVFVRTRKTAQPHERSSALHCALARRARERRLAAMAARELLFASRGAQLTSTRSSCRLLGDRWPAVRQCRLAVRGLSSIGSGHCPETPSKISPRDRTRDSAQDSVRCTVVRARCQHTFAAHKAQKL